MSRLLPRSAPRWLTDPIVGVLARGGVTPNMLTLAGVLGNAGAAALAARGDFLPAGIVMLAASSLDMLDGALARATGKATRFGSVFDAVMDRLSEAAVLFGLLFYFSDRGGREEEMLIFAALVASFLVSYTRARAEIVDVPLREGLFGRAERVLLLGAALIIGEVTVTGLTVGLWVLAVAAGVTAIQRLALVWLRVGRSGDEDG
ncbi:MAG: CDP-alcohol phosphatidyltransferase family protein [Chloroflexi bacterium]|nr:CDP-alcohol phosphatidyltransferase family protein [Chloroflexota bacterium]